MKFGQQLSMALELPVVIIVFVLVGGGIGYFLDHWLHREFVFTLIGGGLGFAAGITDVIRRVLANGKGGPGPQNGNDSSGSG